MVKSLSAKPQKDDVRKPEPSKAGNTVRLGPDFLQVSGGSSECHDIDSVMESPESANIVVDNVKPSAGSSDNLVSMRDGKRCLVKLSLALHVTKPASDRLLTSPVYTAQVLTVVTSSRHHPKYGCQEEVTDDVRVTYDSLGQMVMIEVPYIEAGIYRVVSAGEPRPQPLFQGSSVHQIQLIWTESLDTIPVGSKFLILGEVCQVPSPNHTSQRPLHKRLLEFLYTATFREFTLPVLLGHGEPNLWRDIKGCSDRPPVFLNGEPDYQAWKWLENLSIPPMKPTIRTRGNCAEEPSEPSDNIPFCHYIYQTYISGAVEKSVMPPVSWTEAVTTVSSLVSLPDSESEDDAMAEDVRDRHKGNNNGKRDREHIGRFCKRQKRCGLTIDIKSLCGSPSHPKDPS